VIYEEFLNTLQTAKAVFTPRFGIGHQLVPDQLGMIRFAINANPDFCAGDDQDFCPITAVYFLQTRNYIDISDYELAATQLGINEDLAVAIADAADSLPEEIVTLEDEYRRLWILDIRKDLELIIEKWNS
jgi:hypothetical protein